MKGQRRAAKPREEWRRGRDIVLISPSNLILELHMLTRLVRLIFYEIEEDLILLTDSQFFYAVI